MKRLETFYLSFIVFGCFIFILLLIIYCFTAFIITGNFLFLTEIETWRLIGLWTIYLDILVSILFVFISEPTDKD
jgi:hypothetical protein